MKKIVLVFIIQFVLLLSLPITTYADTQPAAADTYVNIAPGKLVYSSSNFSPDFPLENLIDDNLTTVWGSGTTNNTEWVYIDLGRVTGINGVILSWFDKYFAKRYKVAVSNDSINWRIIYEDNYGTGGTKQLTPKTACRYIGVLFTVKNSIAYGLKEIGVYKLQSTITPTPTPTPTPITTPEPGTTGSYFRVNLLGYLINDKKIAIIGTSKSLAGLNFHVVDAYNIDSIKYTSTVGNDRGQYDTPFTHNYTCDFTNFKTPGEYRLLLDDGTLSDAFSIGALQEYTNALTSLLRFFRSQRCGNTNPVLHKPCHLNDALHKNSPTCNINPAGGWHDAGDYIKYMITNTFACYQLINAADYAQSYNLENAMADISPANGIPDLIEEAFVGIRWILNMTADYANGNYYYQVSGAEDHKFLRLPESDDITGKVGNPRSLHAGWGGNLLGRSAACLAVASRVFQQYDPTLAAECLARAEGLFADRSAYQYSQHSNPVDYYAESSWLDDMVLGAAELYNSTNKSEYLSYASNNINNIGTGGLFWSSCEYLAVAACYRAGINPSLMKTRMQQELGSCLSSAENETYFLSSGYEWGTTALFTADAQKAIMYYYMTNDAGYLDLAVHQRDYLLGRNNWGISFVVGLGERYPVNAHSQLNHLAGLHEGAVVGGPTDSYTWYGTFTNGLPGIDIYEKFQCNILYTDKRPDYICNEVAIDYSAASVFIFMHNIIMASAK